MGARLIEALQMPFDPPSDMGMPPSSASNGAAVNSRLVIPGGWISHPEGTSSVECALANPPSMQDADQYAWVYVRGRAAEYKGCPPPQRAGDYIGKWMIMARRMTIQ